MRACSRHNALALTIGILSFAGAGHAQTRHYHRRNADTRTCQCDSGRGGRPISEKRPQRDLHAHHHQPVDPAGAACRFRSRSAYRRRRLTSRRSMADSISLLSPACRGTSHATGRNHVVVRKDSGIKEPKDLAGKKFAVPGLNAVFHVMVRHWLTQQGVDYKSVNFVEAVFPVHGDMLRSGQVDAVITADPFLSGIINRGDGVSLCQHESAVSCRGNSTMMYVATRDYAVKNPAVIAGFRAAIRGSQGVHCSEPGQDARGYRRRQPKLPPAAIAGVAIPTVDTT